MTPSMTAGDVGGRARFTARRCSVRSLWPSDLLERAVGPEPPVG